MVEKSLVLLLRTIRHGYVELRVELRIFTTLILSGSTFPYTVLRKTRSWYAVNVVVGLW